MEAKTSSYLKIADLKAADLLTDWRKRRFLEPFVPRPMSTSGAAAVLGVKLNAMHYRVGQLLELGLLEVAGSAERKGRAVKLYGPTADAFLVPFAATPHATIVEMIRRLSALDDFLGPAVATLTVQAEYWGFWCRRARPKMERDSRSSSHPTRRAGRTDAAPCGGASSVFYARRVAGRNVFKARVWGGEGLPTRVGEFNRAFRTEAERGRATLSRGAWDNTGSRQQA